MLTFLFCILLICILYSYHSKCSAFYCSFTIICRFVLCPIHCMLFYYLFSCLHTVIYYFQVHSNGLLGFFAVHIHVFPTTCAVSLFSFIAWGRYELLKAFLKSKIYFGNTHFVIGKCIFVVANLFKWHYKVELTFSKCFC